VDHTLAPTHSRQPLIGGVHRRLKRGNDLLPLVLLRSNLLLQCRLGLLGTCPLLRQGFYGLLQTLFLTLRGLSVLFKQLHQLQHLVFQNSNPLFAGRNLGKNGTVFFIRLYFVQFTLRLAKICLYPFQLALCGPTVPLGLCHGFL
jgi:hypothetical protein